MKINEVKCRTEAILSLNELNFNNFPSSYKNIYICIKFVIIFQIFSWIINENSDIPTNTANINKFP